MPALNTPVICLVAKDWMVTGCMTDYLTEVALALMPAFGNLTGAALAELLPVSRRAQLGASRCCGNPDRRGGTCWWREAVAAL